MPLKGYVQTAEHKAKIIGNLLMGQQTGKHWKIKDTSKMKGKHPTSEFKCGDLRLLGNKNRLGITPWNKESHGLVVAWNKGLYGYNTGSLNPNWKGGSSKEEHRIRRTRQWLDWRKKVFERDDYTCKKCGAKSGKNYDGKVYLEAHHRIGVHDLFINNFKNYIFNVDNGITLCKYCHSGVTALQRSLK